MKLKTLALTVACLAVLSALAWWFNRPPAPAAADPRVGKPIVDAAVLSSAARLRLSDQGKTVLLVRQPDGSWRVPSYFDLPADFSKLSGFTNDLSSAKIDRLVSADPEVLKRLEFKDTRIDILDGAGKPLWSLTIGKYADSGGRFVRFGDEPTAYLASLNAYVDSEPKNWADAALLNLKADDVARLEVTFDGGGPVVLSRTKAGAAWTAESTPKGRQVKADAVSSLLSSMGSLRFTDTSALSDPQAVAAAAHARVFRLTTFDGKTYTVTLGRKPEEKKLKPAPAPAKVPETKAASARTSAGGPAAARTAAKEAKPPPPEYETIPAGPVFAAVASSDPNAPVNALMKARAFQIDEYTFTSLPQTPADLFEAAPAAAARKP